MKNRAIYTGIVIFLSLLAGLMFNVWYIGYVDQKNNERDIKRSQQICEVAVYIDDLNRQRSTTTDEQREFIRRWHDYTVSLDCPK